MRFEIRKLLVIKVGLFLALLSSHVYSNVKPHQLMLIGSELELCRSSAKKHCRGAEIIALSKQKNRSPIQYKIVISQLKKMMNVDLWQSSRQALRYDLQILFNAIARKAGTGVISYDQLLSIWKSVSITRDGKRLSGHSLFLSLTKDELMMILDHLEYEQEDYANRRYKEKGLFIESLQTQSGKFAQQIVELSQTSEKKPNILIITAGHRDSFVDVDIYNELFNQLGANASWLPIDAALNKLLADKKSCDSLESYRAKILNSYDRKRLYRDLVEQQIKFCQTPSLFTQSLDAADAVVLLGDNPVLLKKALINNGVDSEILKQIRTKMSDNKLLVVAIGNMVNTLVNKGANGAVVLQGDSNSAMQHGTSTLVQVENACLNYGSCEPNYHTVIYQQGGLGLIDLPVIDVQASSEGTITRLNQVALDNNYSHALNVDKDTAIFVSLLKNQLEIEVIGQQGAILLEDIKNQEYTTNFKYSYLTPGDTLSISSDNVNIQYPEWKNKPGKAGAKLAHYKNLFYSDSFKKFSEQGCVIEDKEWSGNAGLHKQFQMVLTKKPETKFTMGGLKLNNDYELYCSIESLLVEIRRN